MAVPYILGVSGLARRYAGFILDLWGVIPADFKVPCLVEAPEAALETSLMENRIRAALSPADEFVAMAALIDTGETAEAVATRFGVSGSRHRTGAGFTLSGQT